VQPEGEHKRVGERLVHCGTDQHIRAGEVDACRLEYGSSVAPGAGGLALPEDLMKQDRLLDVAGHRGSACDQQGVELVERAVAAVRFTIVSLAPAPRSAR